MAASLHIAGCEAPTEGEITIGNKNVIGMAPAKRDIAMVMVLHSYALYPTMNVADNIGFALEMLAEIKRLHLVSGITRVYVTHDQIEAMTLGSRIAVMKDGILQQIGTPDQIDHLPSNTYVAGFIGAPTMNFITGDVSVTGATGLFFFEGGSLQLPAPVSGRVTLVEPTRADTYVVVKTGAGLITVRTPPSAQVNLGDKVGLTISSRHNNWFDVQSGLRLG